MKKKTTLFTRPISVYYVNVFHVTFAMVTHFGIGACIGKGQLKRVGRTLFGIGAPNRIITVLKRELTCSVFNHLFRKTLQCQ